MIAQPKGPPRRGWAFSCALTHSTGAARTCAYSWHRGFWRNLSDTDQFHIGTHTAGMTAPDRTPHGAACPNSTPPDSRRRSPAGAFQAAASSDAPAVKLLLHVAALVLEGAVFGGTGHIPERCQGASVIFHYVLTFRCFFLCGRSCPVELRFGGA